MVHQTVEWGQGLIHSAFLHPQAYGLMRGREVPMCQHHTYGQHHTSVPGMRVNTREQHAIPSLIAGTKYLTGIREEGPFGLLVLEHTVHHGEKSEQSSSGQVKCMPMPLM